MTPLEISILIECCTTSTPGVNIKPEIWTSAAARECRETFYKEGVTTDDGTATARGRAWLKAICSIPLPQKRWIVPAREAYIIDMGD